MLLIPSLDLRHGRVVRLYQGDFDAETRYQVEPAELLARYRALGAGWLHVVDLDGARDGVPANRAAIVGLAAPGGVRIQAGGGIRSAAAIDDLLGNGVARVVVGSAAVERPRDVVAWLERFGAERICLAFDVKDEPRGEPLVRSGGWTRGTPVSLWQAIEPFLGAGLRHVLCTDVDRDGSLSGPNLDLYAAALARFPQLLWQASGGVRDAADLAALARRGVAAAISGKALLERRMTAEELRPFLPNASSPVSTFATARS